MKNIFLYLLTLSFLLSFGELYAQLKVVPLQHGQVVGKEMTQSRKATVPLVLPFWDDFSTSYARPDTSKWKEGSGVFINSGLAVNPPTKNVATFDGLAQDGKAYAQSPLAKGRADSLVSKTIDLGSLAENEKGTVFFSFFWQLKGNGEQPDETNMDSLVLQFKNQDNRWVTQWPLGVAKTEVFRARTDTFFLEMIQVTEGFQHSGFEFRFINYSRLSGAFDTWHIDYVYLNKNRKSTYRAFDDRAISTPPTSIFKGYTSVPSEVFFNNPSNYLQPASVKVANLHDTLQPISFSSRVELKGKDISKTIMLNEDQELTEPGPIMYPLQRGRAISSVPVMEAFDERPDSLGVETKFYIKSGDYIYFKDIDHRVNDTASNHMIIHNFYAYDDGTAEFGAGVNLSGGRIAYQYVIPVRDTLTHVDIFFPTLGRSVSGATIGLFIAKKLDNVRDEVLYKETHVVQSSSELNQMKRYQLSELVVVKDTIYIGFEQDLDDFLPVGLDKDTDSGNKLYVYDQYGWSQNTGLTGSLMMRPVFAKPDSSLIGDPMGVRGRATYEKLYAYPNPTSGLLYVELNPDELYVVDILGRKFYVPYSSVSAYKSEVNLNSLTPGMYFLYARKKDKMYVDKIIFK